MILHDGLRFSVIAATTAGAVLLFDISQSLGVAGGVPYVLLVLLGLVTDRYRVVLMLAFSATALTILGFSLSSPGFPLEVVLVNRGLALIAIWSVSAATVMVIAQRKRLQQMIDRDHLTQIYNRNYLMHTMRREINTWQREKRPLSLIMADIDKFKAINDQFGHMAGDQVLIEVARICVSTVRVSDHVCRYGGEEFAIILSNTTHQRACEVAERIRHAVEQNVFAVGGKTVQLTVSIGLAEISDRFDNADTLLAAADAALYRAKHSGRNQVHQAPDLRGQGSSLRITHLLQ